MLYNLKDHDVNYFTSCNQNNFPCKIIPNQNTKSNNHIFSRMTDQICWLQFRNDINVQNLTANKSKFPSYQALISSRINISLEFSTSRYRKDLKNSSRTILLFSKLGKYWICQTEHERNNKSWICVMSHVVYRGWRDSDSQWF